MRCRGCHRLHYRYDPKSNRCFHGAGIMVLTPEGKAARYLYGVDYEPKDLKLSVVEASHNRIGSPVERILLFCHHYDPLTGKYTATVLNLLHASAARFLLVLVADPSGPRGDLIFTFIEGCPARHGGRELKCSDGE